MWIRENQVLNFDGNFVNKKDSLQKCLNKGQFSNTTT